MIKAFVFDLDGTLAQTEILKAHSYAKAVEELKPGKYKVHDLVDFYKKNHEGYNIYVAMQCIFLYIHDVVS